MNDDLDDGTPEGAKRAGMGRARRHADPAFMAEVDRIIFRVARRQVLLTIDDVVAEIDTTRFNTHEWRALGPAMRLAAKKDWIKKARQPASPSNRRSRHNAPLTIWQSLICRKFTKP